MKNFYFGVDVGGTTIKIGAVDTAGNIVYSNWTSTKTSTKNGMLAESIFAQIERLCNENNLKMSDALGIGVGLPGLVDQESGILKYACNLGIRDYAITEKLRTLSGLEVKIANDADVSALSELFAGAGKDFSNFILLAIGTGVGGCVIFQKKPLSTKYSGEIGHMKLFTRVRKRCSCGEVGCFETVASTRALVEQTAEAMKKNLDSEMWTKYTPETVSGKTVFEFKEDPTAKTVLENYISYLGDGIVSLINIFMPEAIIISGAISNQKENLIVPLENYVNKHIFAKNAGLKVKFLSAHNTGNAGIVGARFLF